MNVADSNTQSPAGSTGASSSRGQSAGGAGQGVVEQAKGVASQVAERARAEVGARVSERTSRSASELSKVSGALRLAEERLEGNLAGPWAGRAADQIERVARLVEEGDARRLLQEAESWARREPLLFIGSAFGLGLLGARFLKSSAPKRETILAATPGVTSAPTYTLGAEPLP
jgi:hypothetical protein